MFLGCLPCCDGGSEQPCGCGPQEQVRPESLTIELEGFTFAPIPGDPFLIPGDAEGQEAGITTFVAGLGPIVLPLFASGSFGYLYGTLGCSTAQIGEPAIQFRDVGCSSCPPDFYSNLPVAGEPGAALGATPSHPSLRVVLGCDGRVDRRRLDYSTVGGLPEAWVFWRPLVTSGNIANPTWGPSACGNQLWTFDVFFEEFPFITGTVPYFVTPPCSGQFEEFETPGYMLATARALVTDSSLARYNALSGTVRITPNYANPLP